MPPPPRPPPPQFHEDPKQRRVADVMSAEEFKQLQVGRWRARLQRRLPRRPPSRPASAPPAFLPLPYPAAPPPPQARARSSPMFVLPVSKPGGFLTLLLNWQGPIALLTSVEEYKRFGAGAPPHMSVTLYPGAQGVGA
jgi:hypothetical protein